MDSTLTPFQFALAFARVFWVALLMLALGVLLVPLSVGRILFGLASPVSQ